MNYLLRLFEHDAEVRAFTVAYVPGAHNYPLVGQTIDDRWLVLGVISHSDAELRLRVERTGAEGPYMAQLGF